MTLERSLLMLNRTVSAALLGGCALALALAAVRGSPAGSAGSSGHAQIGAFGIYENLHGFHNGAALTDAVKARCRGTFGRGNQSACPEC